MIDNNDTANSMRIARRRAQVAALILLVAGCGRTPGADRAGPAAARRHTMTTDSISTTATFGAGCFWCTEAVFQQLAGVTSVVPGYAGGHVDSPTYEMVCEGTTGHAEAVQITFDPDVISYAELLEVFFKTHDPTTRNRQGNDVGTQYRSVIFYHDPQQRALAERSKRALDEARAFDGPIVTEIVPFDTFYPAEAYHQDYFRRNRSQPYCQFIVVPKLDAFRRAFAEKLKNE